MISRISIIKKASIFLTGNVVAQASSALVGLLLARWLSVPEYAIYTIVISLMGVVSVLTKGGVALGFSAILGKTWPDKIRAAQAISAIHYVRSKVSTLMLPIILIISIVLLNKSGASFLMTGSMILALIIFWLADIRTRVVEQVLFFGNQTLRVQKLDTALALVRLCAIVLLFMIGGISVYSVIGITTLIAVSRVKPISKWIFELVPIIKAKKQANDINEITRLVKRQLPVDIWNVFQMQIIIILLAWGGQASDVAGYGALSRIAQLLVPIQMFTYAFCVPYFSSAKDRITKIYIQLICILSLPGIALVTIAFAFPEALLFLIGPNYANLEDEILLQATVTAIASLAANAWSLLAHRGLAKWSWLQIPAGIVWFTIAAMLLDLSTINGALILKAGFSFGIIAAITAELSTKKKNWRG